MAQIDPSHILLHRFYDHVEKRPNDVHMVQPTGGGAVTEYTFAQVHDQASRMAAHLISLNLPAQSKIAIVSKNCAHFVMTELAIWMAGHVTVALSPTLNADTVSYILGHSEAKLLFVGKLDTWPEIQKGVPEGLPCIAYPLAPKTEHTTWDDITSKTEPLAEKPRRELSDESLIIYTSGSTGQPKGVLHSFATITAPTISLAWKRLRPNRAIACCPTCRWPTPWTAGCPSACPCTWAVRSSSPRASPPSCRTSSRARPTLFVSVPRLWLKFQLGVFSEDAARASELAHEDPDSSTPA